MKPELFLNGRVSLYCGDCLPIMDTFQENIFDSAIIDAPYHLASITKRFSEKNAAPAKRGKTGAFARSSAGFMGKKWDGGDIAFQVSTWERVIRVLKPGAYIAVFSSSRTFGRMSVAIEDAGFITHPMIGWIFGQGFPKAHRIAYSGLSDLDRLTGGWEGYRYGGQALKPALEPIYVGQKPFSEINGSANVQRWGTGALNIDACRVEHLSEADRASATPGGRVTSNRQTGAVPDVEDIGRVIFDRPDTSLGRWPANLMLSCAEDQYALRPNVSREQTRELYRWLSENA